MIIEAIITSLQHYRAGVNCISITEHPARGEGDKWYYDIKLHDGSIIRTFNFEQIEFREGN